MKKSIKILLIVFLSIIAVLCAGGAGLIVASLNSKVKTDYISLTLGDTYSVNPSDFLSREVYERHPQCTVASDDKNCIQVDNFNLTAVGVGNGVLQFLDGGEQIGKVGYNVKFHSEEVHKVLEDGASSTALAEMSSITLKDCALRDFSDLYFMPNLKSITLNNCGVQKIYYDLVSSDTSILNIAKFPQLEELYLPNNSLTDIDVINKKETLKRVDVSNNKISYFELKTPVEYINFSQNEGIVFTNDISSATQFVNFAGETLSFDVPYTYKICQSLESLTEFLRDSVRNPIADITAVEEGGVLAISSHNPTVYLLGGQKTYPLQISVTSQSSCTDIVLHNVNITSEAPLNLSGKSNINLKILGGCNFTSTSANQPALYGNTVNLYAGPSASAIFAGADGDHGGYGIYTIADLTVSAEGAIISAQGGSSSGEHNGGTGIYVGGAFIFNSGVLNSAGGQGGQGSRGASATGTGTTGSKGANGTSSSINGGKGGAGGVGSEGFNGLKGSSGGYGIQAVTVQVLGGKLTACGGEGGQGGQGGQGGKGGVGGIGGDGSGKYTVWPFGADGDGGDGGVGGEGGQGGQGGSGGDGGIGLACTYFKSEQGSSVTLVEGKGGVGGKGGTGGTGGTGGQGGAAHKGYSGAATSGDGGAGGKGGVGGKGGHGGAVGAGIQASNFEAWGTVIVKRGQLGEGGRGGDGGAGGYGGKCGTADLDGVDMSGSQSSAGATGDAGASSGNYPDYGRYGGITVEAN